MNDKLQEEQASQSNGGLGARRPTRALTLLLAMAGAGVGTLVVAYVLVTMFQRKQEARMPFVRVANVSEISTNPVPWGKNWPHQFDGWKATAGHRFYGGSSAMPESKLEQQPWLRRLYAGYAFSIDYREARGHAYMLYDQGVTERVTKKPQAGACLHCHASITVAYRMVGLKAMGRPVNEATLAADFDREAVIRGFKEVSRRPYQEVLRIVARAPDGTLGDAEPVFPQPPPGGFTGEMAGEPVDKAHPPLGEVHPVTCIDCHDPKTMEIRVTRPGFLLGIAALAAGDAEVPHLLSIDRWRKAGRASDYDPNTHASHQEMRSFVCAQCHVEYYCANKAVLTFPWRNGLRMEDAERFWDEMQFDDGTRFYDYEHGETGAKVYKVQHPEFELWSQGIHAQSGVSCADCHMPYERKGAMKVSNHTVQSPLYNLNNACQHCHNVPEAELRDRIETIQSRTVQMTERAAGAMTDMLDAILEAKVSGVAGDKLAPVFALQRQSMWRLDYISSENSKGFHADQEAMRILAESIDLSRQAQAAALRLRAPQAPSIESIPTKPVEGVSDATSEPVDAGRGD